MAGSQRPLRSRAGLDHGSTAARDLRLPNSFFPLYVTGIANGATVFFLRGYVESAVPDPILESARLERFASPWSPPTWMKFPNGYAGGSLSWRPEIPQAYATYFAKLVQAYEAEGITIQQIHVQNEPVAYEKLPSCLWSGERLKEFIREYLGPALERRGIQSEIWLGTINAPGGDYNRIIFDKLATEDCDFYADTVLQDECGLGDNTWQWARHVFTCIKHYLANGCESYAYWNMVLEPGGTRSWGDDQNAMVTVDPASGRVVYSPDFYV